MVKNIKIVIDTNVFVASLSSKSSFHWLIENLIDEKFDLLVTTEILLEYEEILKRKYSLSVVENFLRALRDLPNVSQIDVRYKWRLIIADEDDDKFVDLAIAGNANFLITNDKHFNVLKSVDFPHVVTLTLKNFEQILSENA
jgi:uncharacterized protein